MEKIVTFGEIMLKLSAPNYQRWEQSSQFNVEFAGAETNVAISLARFGTNVSFVSKLPNNELGDMAIKRLKQQDVCTQFVKRGGERIGIYFVEKGASQRPSKVLYDRQHSSIAEATIDEFDWNTIFDGATWFHLTGITPALGENVSAICLKACQTAKEKGLTVSCDLNYRSKLWTTQKANEVMRKLVPYVDVCIANETDAMDVLGVKSEELINKFGFKIVCVTQRDSYSASDNGWSAIMYTKDNILKSKKYDIHIVDRIGGGDSFAAGLIYGLLNHKDNLEALEFAVAASCLKQTIEGDINLAQISEIEALISGSSNGRIQR